ncbi:MAG: hypothetical protein KME27_15810 [Lyngbya sp. HA4199-MV5]|nr:hypothetical protein [Lyngbya sp. HA4199-MV5]
MQRHHLATIASAVAIAARQTLGSSSKTAVALHRKTIAYQSRWLEKADLSSTLKTTGRTPKLEANTKSPWGCVMSKSSAKPLATEIITVGIITKKLDYR